MSAARDESSWIEANQALLVAEFARIKDRLSGKSGDDSEAAPQRARSSMPAPSAVDRLCGLFGLNAFERSTLLLCAGVEMDSNLATLCGEAQGHPQRQYATFGLAMAIFSEAQWGALLPTRPLRRFRLVEVASASQALTSAALRIDERILHYLAGLNVLDARLDALLQGRAAPDCIAADHEIAAAQAVRVLASPSLEGPILHLCGDDPNGQEDTAAVAALRAGRQLYVVRSAELPAVGPDLEQFAVLWQREALLAPAALLIQCAPGGYSAAARHLAERIQGMVFVASGEPLRFDRAFLRFEVSKPPPPEQKRLWQKALGPRAAALNGTLDDLSEQFRLSARMIYSTGSLIASSKDEIAADQLWNACRSLARPKLEDLAQRIVPAARWDDLVLPDAQQQTLRQLAAQVRHRMTVYESWGFSARGRRGLGVSALFTGESGTGKTLAAEVIASELGLDLYRIDLASVVSKYIGETEKNLKQVFDAAEEGGVLLLFDEADALFGKRGEVRYSHDRYANIEVGYLLQRMESYAGLAILTTNLKASLDKAFERRLRFTVHFPFPDVKQREAIWGRVFPPTTPTTGLDSRKLAQLSVTGGNIRNIALNAAFLAAASTRSVNMEHVLQAARLEAHKVERPLSDAETRGWV
jgi:ATPase family protein associated with various cellular activities (AAA)/winged helix domain-containing protein